MSIRDIYSVDGILKEIGSRVRQYRISCSMTQKMLAVQSGVSLRSIVRLEAGEDIMFGNLIRILDSLGLKNNLEMLAPDMSRRPSHLVSGNGQRKRASSPRTKMKVTAQKKWKWGDEA